MKTVSTSLIHSKNKISFLTSKFRNFSKLKHLFNIQNLCIQFFLLKNFGDGKQESPKEFRFPTEIAEIHTKNTLSIKKSFSDHTFFQNLINPKSHKVRKTHANSKTGSNS
jgi:hypothetical protein